MFDYMNEELTEQQTEALIDKAAHEIVRRKMSTPAVLFLEMHKPLSYVASQASIVFAPFMVPLLGYDNVHNYSRLIADRQNVERLICRIERLAGEVRTGANTEAQIG